MSIWNKNIKERKRNILDKNISVDILIIGAGITGMTSAYYLKDKDICVVDSNKVGYGSTLNSTAKINFLQERVYNKIINLRSRKVATSYLNSQLDAINFIKEIIEKNNIDCDFKKVASYLIATKESEVEPLKLEIDFLLENNIDIKEKKLPFNINYYNSYMSFNTYIFNPIKYLEGLYNLLKDKIEIYEYTKIIKINKEKDYYICYTDKYKIKANKIVLACHYPYFTLPFLLPFKSTIEKSYIIISKINKDLKYTFINTNKPTYSCRFYSDKDNIYQISLSESHDISFKQNDKDNFKKVIDKFNIKEENIVMKYSNTDIMTLDHIPYIGRLKDNMYIGTGYNTWGMTNGVLAAKIISDMIIKKENKYIKIFDPNRFNISNVIKLPIIIFNQTKSFIGTKIYKNKYWYSNKINIINKKLKSYGVYIDKNGKHIVKNKCPNLGCTLVFNEVEITWDCPCHSSRFDIDGKCIKGPSNYDISI